MPFELRYINHSCSPNVLFDIEGGVLRALRDIEPGDELRSFYPATEWEMAQAFDCKCGAADCEDFIVGASQMRRDILDRHVLSGFIQEKLGIRTNGSPKRPPALLDERVVTS